MSGIQRIALAQRVLQGTSRRALHSSGCALTSENAKPSSPTTSTGGDEALKQSEKFVSEQAHLQADAGSTETSPRKEVSRDMASEAESSNSWIRKLLMPSPSPPSKPSPKPTISSKLNPEASWGARLTPSTKFTARPSVGSRAKRAQGLTKSERQTTASFTQTMLEIFESSARRNFPEALAGPKPAWRGPSTPPEKDFEYYRNTSAPFTRINNQRSLKKEESEEDAETIERLEELKEDMEVIRTDNELLQWAIPNILTPKMVDGLPVFEKVYPRILAHLIKVFRVNYQNPHLALAIFNYAQTSSVDSYLSGCLAPAYNELLRVRWDSFRDFEGVEVAVREMEVNGVGWDRVTSKIIAGVIEEVQKDLQDGVIRGDEAVYARLQRLEKRLERDIRDQEAFENYRQGERKFMRQWAERSASGTRRASSRDRFA